MGLARESTKRVHAFSAALAAASDDKPKTGPPARLSNEEEAADLPKVTEPPARLSQEEEAADDGVFRTQGELAAKKVLTLSPADEKAIMAIPNTPMPIEIVTEHDNLPETYGDQCEKLGIPRNSSPATRAEAEKLPTEQVDVDSEAPFKAPRGRVSTPEERKEKLLVPVEPIVQELDNEFPTSIAPTAEKMKELRRRIKVQPTVNGIGAMVPPPTAPPEGYEDFSANAPRDEVCKIPGSGIPFEGKFPPEDAGIRRNGSGPIRQSAPIDPPACSLPPGFDQDDPPEGGKSYPWECS
jgi:hypothetical protein